MNETINLKDKKHIIGLSNIILSEVDETVYINTRLQVNDGIKGSLTYYENDGQIISSTGSDFYFDPEKRCIFSKEIKSKKIISEIGEIEKLTADSITVENILINNGIKSLNLYSRTVHVEDFLNTLKLSIDRWLGFPSIVKENEHPFKLKVIINPDTEEETLVFISDDYSNSKPKVAMGFDKNKIFFKNTINIKNRTIESQLGSEKDMSGDVAIDENYIYYCFKNYDGVNNIWKRIKLEDWQ